MNKKITIIIVNFNGARDTIDCLESLFHTGVKGYLRVVLIDNASVESSTREIIEWMDNNRLAVKTKFRHGRIVDKEVLCEDYIGGSDVFLRADQNYGFAVANNIGISYARKIGSKYIMLLNNDTVVHESSISYMFDYIENSDASVVIPQIRLFSDPEIIWNCGGELTWYGSKRYNFARHNFKTLDENASIQVSFFTGCAVLFKSEVFDKVGLLTEDYFFGTEDLNYSQRLAVKHIKVYCLHKAIIYHKVGQTIRKENLAFAILNHYLGHFINQKKRSTFFIWLLWGLCYNFYIFLMLLYRYHMSIFKVTELIFFLTKYSIVWNDVNQRRYYFLKNKFK